MKKYFKGIKNKKWHKEHNVPEDYFDDAIIVGEEGKLHIIAGNGKSIRDLPNDYLTDLSTDNIAMFGYDWYYAETGDLFMVLL